jgi:hypothetical protein
MYPSITSILPRNGKNTIPTFTFYFILTDTPRTDQTQARIDTVPVSIPPEKILTLPAPESIESKMKTHDDQTDNDSDSDDSDSDYLSFEDNDDDNDEEAAAAKEAREREKQRVLEAAGLIVNQNVGPPPLRPKARSIKRRPAPAAPRREPSFHKDLPPVPDTEPEPDPDPEPEPAPIISHEARLDDAFARYESFKNSHAANAMNRLSVVSTDSTSGTTMSPTVSSASAMSLAPSQGSQKDTGGGEGRYSNFLHFLTGGKGQGEGGSGERRTAASLNISAPMMINSASNQSTPQDGPSRSNSPSFGMVCFLLSSDALGVCIYHGPSEKVMGEPRQQELARWYPARRTKTAGGDF